jgi:hypothetical protein
MTLHLWKDTIHPLSHDAYGSLQAALGAPAGNMRQSAL